MSEADLGWAAGFLDGEGCIYLNAERQGNQVASRKKRTMRPGITVTNTCLTSLHRFRHIVGVGQIYPMKRYQAHHKPTWKLFIRNNGQVEKALVLLAPHLTVKKTLAYWLLAFIHLSGSRNGGKYGRVTEFQRNIYECIRLTNRRSKAAPATS